jgi:hypothetical protein
MHLCHDIFLSHGINLSFNSKYIPVLRYTLMRMVSSALFKSKTLEAEFLLKITILQHFKDLG